MPFPGGWLWPRRVFLGSQRRPTHRPPSLLCLTFHPRPSSVFCLREHRDRGGHLHSDWGLPPLSAQDKPARSGRPWTLGAVGKPVAGRRPGGLFPDLGHFPRPPSMGSSPPDTGDIPLSSPLWSLSQLELKGDIKPKNLMLPPLPCGPSTHW